MDGLTRPGLGVRFVPMTISDRLRHMAIVEKWPDCPKRTKSLEKHAKRLLQQLKTK